MAGTPGSIGGFVMDVTILEDHFMENEVTDDPVEEGAPTNNHIRRKSNTLTLECAVTDHPMGEMATVRAKADAAQAAINSIIPVQQPLDPYGSITEECRAYMERLIEECEPVVVVTSIRTYDSMALVSFREARSSESGEAMRFTAQLKKLRIVTNERTTTRVAVPRAAKKKNRGHLPAIETADDARNYMESVRNRKPKGRPLTDEEQALFDEANKKVIDDREYKRYLQQHPELLTPIDSGGVEGHF